MSSVTRTVLRIGTAPQLWMFGPLDFEGTGEESKGDRDAAFPGPDKPGRDGGTRFELTFEDPDPRLIRRSALRLDDFLQSCGLLEPLAVRDFLRSMDWSRFESAYRPELRKPYAPVCRVGLVLYALLRGVSSLLGIEELARLDLGGQWITGGLMPDHSSVGRFINRHAEILTEAFFENLTREVLGRTGSQAKSLAGDGTVIQAAASRYHTLKAEAAQKAHARAREQAEHSPFEDQAQQKAEHAEQVAAVAVERQKARQARGRDTGSAVVAPSEPEAVLQPLKNGAKAPSYKGSVLANAQRIVVGKHVEAASEIKAVEPMLDQAERIGKTRVEQVRFDAGYFCDETLTLAVQRDLDVLIPEGKANGNDDWEKQSEKQFPRSRFIYEPEPDRYRCPTGEFLVPVGRCKGNETQKGYVLYRAEHCEKCPLKEKCTTSEVGRSLKRYAGEETKEAMREVMQQEGARKAYQKRQAWVEPVFRELTGAQGFRRFRRRGLTRVRLEFSLQLCTYHLRRWLALTRVNVRRVLPILVAILLCMGLLCGSSEGQHARAAATKGTRRRSRRNLKRLFPILGCLGLPFAPRAALS